MQSRRASWLAVCLAALLAGLPGMSAAQDILDQDVLDQAILDPESLPEFDRRTPLSAALGFMRFAEQGDFIAAADYLDLRFLPDNISAADGPLLAEQLYIIASRKMPISFGDLADTPDGLSGDGLPSYRDVLARIAGQNNEQPMFLQLVPGPDDTRVWKISNASVARIPELYERYGYSPIVESIRQIAPPGSFLGAETFKWLIALGSGLLAAGIWLAIVWPLGRILAQRRPANAERIRRFLSRPVTALLFALVGVTTLKELGLGATASRLAEGGTFVTLATVWLLFSVTNLLRDLYAQYLTARGRESGLMLLRPITTTVKVLVAILALVVWLDNIGVNVTALLAGLGVGGLSVALVLQKPLEDIMGAITLYTQQPVTVGQFCTCGDTTGTVEEINLRTTRIRTLANTVVVIPNSTFATASIENVAARRRILHRQTVRLALDTPATTITAVLEQLHQMLQSVETVTQEDFRVRLVGFGEFSIDAEIFAYVETTDWAEFLRIAEDINLQTVAALETCGAKFAVPPR